MGQPTEDGTLVCETMLLRFLAFMPFERRTWEFAAARGDEVATWYWEHPPFPRGEGDDAAYAVSNAAQIQAAFRGYRGP